MTGWSSRWLSPPLQALALALLAGALGACGGGAQTPQETLRQYAEALERADADAAWRLLGPSYRATTSEERFAQDFARRLEAAALLEEQLGQAARQDASLSASLPYSRYETLELAFIDGRWRITGGVGGFYDQSSPRQTLVAFIRAVEQRDVEQLLQLVPAEYRAQMTAEDLEAWLERRGPELEETVALLEANVDTPIVQADEQATLRYGAREMRFVKEGSRWVIADFD